MRPTKTLPPPSDAELIARAQGGESAAFEALVERYRDALVRVAQSRLGCREAAEDAAQETLLAAYRYRASYRPVASFRTWLWTILLNQCTLRAKRAGRQVESNAAVGGAAGRSQSWGEVFSRESGPLENVLANERRERLEQLLTRLTPAQADALRLRFFAGLKFREIAVAMECSLATAKNRVRWGLLRLASLLDAARVDAQATATVQRKDDQPPRGDAR